EQASVLDPVDPGAGVPHGAAGGRVGHASLADHPPSTETMAPDTTPARSDARKAATSATSAGWPARPSAAFSNISGNFLPPDSPMISVWMHPGQIALTRHHSAPY